MNQDNFLNISVVTMEMFFKFTKKYYIESLYY